MSDPRAGMVNVEITSGELDLLREVYKAAKSLREHNTITAVPIYAGTRRELEALLDLAILNYQEREL